MKFTMMTTCFRRFLVLLSLGPIKLAVAFPGPGEIFGQYGENVGVEYDFIVVGGGTAGTALATRLSQGLPHASILLVEAGPAAPGEERINIPGMAGSTLGTVYDWNFTTVPQPATKNRVWAANRGKVLGGSSALNFMGWNRASAPEYDWAGLGNVGWSWDTMSAAMKRSETFTPSPYYGFPGIARGYSGPVNTSINRIIPSYQPSWIPTLNNLGVSLNQESLGGELLGVMYQPSSIDSVIYNRSYAANSYLPHAGKNLKVLTNTRVAKINLKKSSGRVKVATGITLESGVVLSAREEVILSAGTFQSPGLLELSGIGRKSVLSAANISQIIDLAGVGENIQDHVAAAIAFQLKDNHTSIDELQVNATYSAEQLALWRAGKVSYYDSAFNAYAYVNWKQISSTASRSLQSLARSLFAKSGSVSQRHVLSWLENNPKVPQIEVVVANSYFGSKGYPPVGSPLYGKNFISIAVSILHPFSQGSIHVASANISDTPVLDPKYMSNEYDIQAAIEGLKYARKIANTVPLRDVFVAEYEPGTALVPDTPGTTSDAQYRDYVLNATTSIWHPVGSCAMLPRKDGGVVSPALRVYGTANLRVADASVIPVIISAHTQTAVYGIAERAAELII
ncbi:GMC oxidoreductase, partial [Podospora didyma]